MGIGEGILAVTDSNENLGKWWEQGARLSVTADAISACGSGTVFGNLCQSAAKDAVDYWNEEMAHRSVRLALQWIGPLLGMLLTGAAGGIIAQRYLQKRA